MFSGCHRWFHIHFFSGGGFFFAYLREGQVDSDHRLVRKSDGRHAAKDDALASSDAAWVNPGIEDGSWIGDHCR